MMRIVRCTFRQSPGAAIAFIEKVRVRFVDELAPAAEWRTPSSVIESRSETEDSVLSSSVTASEAPTTHKEPTEAGWSGWVREALTRRTLLSLGRAHWLPW
jgi:hypothetical protein